MKVFFLFFICLITLTSCSRTYIGKDVLRADEFIADSYLIREGKMSILALEGKSISSLSPEMLEEYPDIIVEDDVLSIGVYLPGREDLSLAVAKYNNDIGYRVIRGAVLLPDAQEICVAGLSIDQARQKIKDYYENERNLHDIDVLIDYAERPQHKIEFIGDVAVSTIPVDGKLRLFDALSRARIAMNANLFMSYVIRNGIYLPVDINKLIKEGDMTQNIVMRGGDKVFIAPTGEATIMIMGEVGIPTAMPVTKGYISIKEALVYARGINITGNKLGILVIRGNVLNPKIYLLTWNQIIHLPNDSTLLMPGDTVYVTSTILADWNRFISQLLPSFEGIKAAHTTSSVVMP